MYVKIMKRHAGSVTFKNYHEAPMDTGMYLDIYIYIRYFVHQEAEDGEMAA